MSHAKRLLLVSVLATFANLGVFVVWVALSSGWTDLDKLFDQPLAPFLFFFGIAYLITAFGLSLLILLASPLLSRVSNRVTTIPTFIGLGGLLGWGMFAWTPDPSAFALCGAFSALIGALSMPGLFGPVRRELAQDTLAD
jgi:hypothetical protein